MHIPVKINLNFPNKNQYKMIFLVHKVSQARISQASSTVLIPTLAKRLIVAIKTLSFITDFLNPLKEVLFCFLANSHICLYVENYPFHFEQFCSRFTLLLPKALARSVCSRLYNNDLAPFCFT